MSLTYTITQADLNQRIVTIDMKASALTPSDIVYQSPISFNSFVLTQQPSYQITSEFSCPPNLTLGDTITYQIVVTNTGNITLQIVRDNVDTQIINPNQDDVYNGSHVIDEVDIMNGYYLVSHVYQISDTFGIDIATETVTMNYDTIVPCLACDSLIMMADNSLKMIQDIRRGDRVYGDLAKTIVCRVSRLIVHQVRPERPMDLTIIKQNSFGQGCPAPRLLLNSYHAIVWQGMKKPAKCFADLPTVTRHLFTKTAAEIIPLNRAKRYALYDIQFDTPGYYVANGIQVQSRHPWSINTPLPRQLYFDPSKYSTVRITIDDDPTDQYSLDLSKVTLNDLRQ
jgi:hypothetical protein